MTLRETALQAALDETKQAESYSHRRNYWRLFIYRDGTVGWREFIGKNSDLIDDHATHLAAIPSAITVGTGTYACDCPFCSDVYDEGEEQIACEEGREYDRTKLFESFEDAIASAVCEADLGAYEETVEFTFNNVVPVDYFDDEEGK